MKTANTKGNAASANAAIPSAKLIMGAGADGAGLGDARARCDAALSADADESSVSVETLEAVAAGSALTEADAAPDDVSVTAQVADGSADAVAGTADPLGYSHAEMRTPARLKPGALVVSVKAKCGISVEKVEPDSPSCARQHQGGI